MGNKAKLIILLAVMTATVSSQYYWDTMYDMCKSYTCRNGGTCYSELSGLSCGCFLHSPESTNDCVEKCSKDRFVCKCRDGFSGNRCATEFDPCSLNPCQNGGSCHPHLETGYWYCDCYSHSYENFYECQTKCNQNKFVCKCMDGSSGDRCEVKIDYCSQNPCQNGGTCVNGAAGYTCNCPKGYVGSTCEQDFCPPGHRLMLNQYIGTGDSCDSDFGSADTSRSALDCKKACIDSNCNMMTYTSTGICQVSGGFYTKWTVNEADSSMSCYKVQPGASKRVFWRPAGSYSAEQQKVTGPLLNTMGTYRNKWCGQSMSTLILRNGIIHQMDLYQVKKVRFAILDADQNELHFVLFKHNEGDTIEDFFRYENYEQSSWAISKPQTVNLWWHKGQADELPNRSFYILDHHKGCPNDRGWFVALQGGDDPCTWAQTSNPPQYLYSTSAHGGLFPTAAKAAFLELQFVF